MKWFDNSKIQDIDAAIRANMERKEKINKNIDKLQTTRPRDHAAIDAERDERQKCEIVARILQDNKRITLFAAVMPEIVDVLTKYNGKPQGEKTREKIKNEIIEKTGCSFYFGTSKTACIIPLNRAGYSGNCGFAYSDFDIHSAYKDGERLPMLIDNKINVLPVADYVLTNAGVYRHDPEKTAEKIFSDHKKIREKFDELQALCSEYNAELPMRIEHINPPYCKPYIV